MGVGTYTEHTVRTYVRPTDRLMTSASLYSTTKHSKRHFYENIRKNELIWEHWCDYILYGFSLKK